MTCTAATHSFRRVEYAPEENLYFPDEFRKALTAVAIAVAYVFVFCFTETEGGKPCDDAFTFICGNALALAVLGVHTAIRGLIKKVVCNGKMHVMA